MKYTLLKKYKCLIVRAIKFKRFVVQNIFQKLKNMNNPYTERVNVATLATAEQSVLSISLDHPAIKAG